MANRIPRVPVREQAPKKRAANFEEVCYGYNAEEAMLEATRCLHCRNPRCVAACPVNVKIPDFIAKVVDGDFAAAAKVIAQDSSLPAVCGRVCPQETQCEGSCVLGVKFEPVAIGKLERFVADWSRENAAGASGYGACDASTETYSDEIAPEAFEKLEGKVHENVRDKAAGGNGTAEGLRKNGHRVAVVGSGPAGLACASDLAKLGYDVTIFEALHKAGGVLEYGIPEFRLPKDTVLAAEIAAVRALGVRIETDVVVGRTVTVDSLLGKEGFDAVFIGSGAGLPKFMGIPGESLNGVYSANEFLTRNNLMKAYRDDYATPVSVGRDVVVVGGGNVAMDAARTALRLQGLRAAQRSLTPFEMTGKGSFEMTDAIPAESTGKGSSGMTDGVPAESTGCVDTVTVVYRRTETELPARREEVHHAKEEGIRFEFLTNPVEILSDEKGNVRGIRCIRMELGEPDASGRRSPVAVPGSEFEIPADIVIMSLGTSPNPLIAGTTPGLKTTRRGGLETTDEVVTTHPGVFAGGDAVTGAATVILAMGAGRKAAAAIDSYIKNR